MSSSQKPPGPAAPGKQSGKQSVKTPGKTRPDPVRRRRFLQRCLGALGGIGSLMAVYPLIRYIEPPPEAEGANRVEIDRASLPPGTSRTVIYRGRPTIVVNTSDGYIAYNAVCPHLGCVVKWEGGTQSLICPCHGGIFGTDGSVQGGPIPGPLTAVELSVTDDKIIVGV